MKARLLNLENGKISTRNINPKYIQIQYNLFDFFGSNWTLMYKYKYQILSLEEKENEDVEKINKTYN